MWNLRFEECLQILILLLLCVCNIENGALKVKIREDLGSKSDVRAVKVNISLLNYEFEAIAETNGNVPLCEKFLVIKAGETAMRIRSKPKGACQGCCQIQSKDIEFQFYTKDHPNEPIILPHDAKRRLESPNLNKNTKVIIYIHGFLEITEVGSSHDMKNAYLSRNEDYGVIIIDWSDLVSFPWYMNAVLNVKKVASILANFLKSYNDAGIISIRNVHIIGYSLGAHVAGFAGKYLRRDLRIPRITGLDPAYPGFQKENDKYRLSKTDADFVDIIHTDGGNFGFLSPLGHVDFYPNDGTYYQPGCEFKFLQSKNQLYNIISCSHNFAYKLYIESVYSPYNFPAMKCVLPKYARQYVCSKNDVAYMGFAVNKSSSGSYFLKTNKEPPYGRSSFDIRSGER